MTTKSAPSESWTSRFAASKDGCVVDTEPWREELRLFFTRFRPGASAPAVWATRCESWMKHVNAYTRLEAGLPTDCDHPSLLANVRDARIRFLFEHLNVLDTKASIVLTFNSLLLLAASIQLNALFNALAGPWSQPPVHDEVFASWLFYAFALMLGAFGMLWLTITSVTLLAFGRVVWGDLYLTSEQEHVKQLIIAVARRTNNFRAAVPLTIANVFLVVAAAITIVILRHQFG